MAKTFLQASQIGCYAHESLGLRKTGKVMGGTSKGLFLQFENKSVFLTRSMAASPFNICLGEDAVMPDQLEAGDVVFYAAGDLLIPSRQVTISLMDARVWTPPSPEEFMLPVQDRQNALQRILDQVKKFDSPKGFLFLARESEKVGQFEQQVSGLVDGFTSSFMASSSEGCLKNASDLFGLGGGLTPSGDDLITGFMLYHFRADHHGADNDTFLSSLGERLTQLAYQRTTFVSANRMEAACRGWSEATFIDLVDGASIKNGNDEEKIARRLFEFGHSSGVDTLLGICLAAGVDLKLRQ